MKEESKKTNRLYIIGNGFDIHHGIKTNYHSFAEYLHENDSQLYDLLVSYFYYSQGDEDVWWRFEENLANIDVDQILEDNSDYLPDIASDDFRDRDLHSFPDIMQDILKRLTSGLVAKFTSFIRAVETPNDANKKILELDKDALFFTFNFTYTLEDLYNIDSKNVLHIHNGAESRYVDIILGHGINPENFKKKEVIPPDYLSKQELEKWYEQQNDNWDYSYDTGKENILQYFAASYKPTKKIIFDKKSYFEGLSYIKEVFVLGHSLANVDLPYFNEIFYHVDNHAKWIVSYYSESEIISHKERLRAIGVDESNIELVKLSELQISSKLQLKIEFK